jgi:predicted Zn-dependent protease
MSSEQENNVVGTDLTSQLARINEYLENRDYSSALKVINQLQAFEKTPLIMSAQALCMAEVNKEYKAAVNMCHEAIKKEPKNTEHYYRQGRILILSGRKKDSIWVLRMGLRHGKHKGIIDLLGSMGIRRPPPFNFLARSNPLNIYLGKLLTRLNLR